MALHQRLHEPDVAGTARDDAQRIVQMPEVQLGHDAVAVLLDEELARSGHEFLLDQRELTLGEVETLGAIRVVGLGVRKEDLGGRLLHDGSRDARAQNMVRALCEGHDVRVLLAPRLQAVLCEARECGVVQQLGELVHPAHQRPAIDHAVDEME
ncbi:unnamed protein product, partial [Brugia timori]|uniref:NAD-specific glutamate dehydrogenase n=1 Tax=Brugia timori TaxID=42155 RepID=A0A0R3QJA8_9BILA